MSYILEALKKSEQERARERGALPDIKSVHTPSSTLHRDERNWWPIVLVAVIVIAGALLAVLYITRSAPQTELAAKDDISAIASDRGRESPLTAVPIDKNTTINPSVSTVTNDDAAPVKKPAKALEQKKQSVVFSKQELQRDDVIGNVDEQREQAAAEEKAQRLLEQKATVEANTAPLAISEIPDGVRKKIPNIAFEGHIFSSVPARRSVMINGRKMREGEVIGGDLMLMEITPEGAEFEYQGYRFKLNALQDWSFK